MAAEDVSHDLDHLTVAEMADLFPARHLLDCDHVETGVAEIIFDERPGDGIVTGADDALGAQRLHGADLVHPRGEDGDSILVFPASDDALLTGIAVDHEGRRALRVDEIDLEAGRLGDAAIILRHDRLKLLDGTVLDPAIDRMGTDTRRQHAYERVMGARAVRGGLDHPDEAACHAIPSSDFACPDGTIAWHIAEKTKSAWVPNAATGHLHAPA